MFERFKSLTIATFGKISTATLILITLVSISFGLFWVDGVQKLGVEWRAYEENVERKASLLVLLRSTIGYGGLIHNVKNYILRKDNAMLIKGHETLLELDVILKAYRHTGISQNEEISLLVIETVISQYRNALIHAEKLIHQGLPIAEIDQAIKVDDGAAFRAFAELENGVVEFRHANLSDLGERVAGVSKLIIYSTVIFGLMMIILSVLYGWFIRTRIVSPITKLVRAFDNIDPNTMSKARLPVEDDVQPEELSHLANSGNRFLKTVDVLLKERQRMEEQVSAIVQNTGEGIVTIDAKGRIELFNLGAESIFGYKAEEIIGENVAILLPEGERIEHDQFVQQSEIYAPRIINRARDLEGQRKNGELFPLELNVAPMVFEDERKFVGILRDVSERKEQEINLIAARDEAEAANLAKSNFLSSMSHELRTPMNAILGFGQLLENNPGEQLSPRQLDYMGHILKSGDHLLDLINQVLELSKIETGNFSVSFEAFDVSDVMEEAVAMIMRSAVENGIYVGNLKDSQQLPLVWADRSRVRQVLLNLLSNAIKYNQKDGRVILDAAIIGSDQIQISVSDTGHGIPKEKHDQLFEPFNRLGREAGEIEGSGIGLTITKEIVDLLGGIIEFESKVEIGSVFKVPLPLAQPHQIIDIEQIANEALPTKKLVTEGNKAVLYIEDNPANLSLMHEVVKLIPNMDMLSAHNAEIGLAVARDNNIDVILMDINLPGMSGIEALKVLRAHSDTRSIPVIAITAAAMPKEIELGKKAGFEEYIVKPIRIPEVLAAIEKHMK